MESHSDRVLSVPTTRCTFVLEGVDAESVAVVGSFNEWSTTRDLMKRVNRRWEATIDLTPGRHSYCFFVIPKGAIRGTLVQMGSTIDVSFNPFEPAVHPVRRGDDLEFFTNECLTTPDFAD